MTKEWTIDRLLLHPDLALRELNKAALSAAEPVPVAYRHTLYMELSQTDIEVNTNEKHPFGRPGVDYSPEYRITTEPLYAAPPAPSVAVKALADAYQKYLDASALYNERLAIAKTKAPGTMRVDEERKAIDDARRAFDKLAVEVATSALSAQLQDVAEVSPAEYMRRHDAAIAAYEANTPNDYRYSALALRKAVDAAFAVAAAPAKQEG